MSTNRIEQPKVKEIITLDGVHHALGDNQIFMGTAKSWEIWDERPLLRFVKRFSAKQVIWVIGK